MCADIAAVVIAAVLQSALPADPPPGQQPAAQAQAAQPTPEALGVSLARIRRQLRTAPPTGAPSAFRYQFHVEVVGKEPTVDFFRDFVLSKEGGVRYGGPTHSELINAATPFPFRMYGGVDLLHRK